MKFSITIPSFKSRYLDEAIRSVVCQTYSDWELIIVDDCSPEDIAGVVKPYLTDYRVRYYRNEKNCGAENVVDNWNICLNYCTGDYVICMGDDDVLLPCCLEEYRRCIDKHHDVDVVYGETAIIDESSKMIKSSSEHPEWESVYDFMLNLWKGRDLFIGDVLIKTERLRSMGGYKSFPLAWGSDHVTTIMAGERNGIVSTDRVVFHYRQHSRTLSMSKTNLEAKLAADKAVFEWYKNFLDKALTKDRETLCMLRKLRKRLPFQRNIRFALDLAEASPHQPLEIIKNYKKNKRYGMNLCTLLFAFYCSFRKP